MRGEAATSPESIKELMSLERPDVVLLDQLCRLDKGDGGEILGELTAYSLPVPVLLLTSQNTLANRLEAARLVARRFTAFHKP